MIISVILGVYLNKFVHIEVWYYVLLIIHASVEVTFQFISHSFNV